MPDNSIFDANADLTVDFSEYEINLRERAYRRLLYQFRNSPVIRDYTFARVDTLELARNAVISAMELRTIANASDAVMDVIGRIVGQPRILLNSELRQWFGTDVRNQQIGRVDRTTAFSQGASLFGDLPAGDFDYRRLIIAKIFKNHVTNSSIPELIEFVKIFTGDDVSFKAFGTFDIDMIVPLDIAPGDVVTLSSVEDDEFADRRYLVPIAAGVRLRKVIYRPALPFAPDRGQPHATDAGLVSVGFNSQEIAGAA